MDKRPYNPKDLASVLRYASKLTGNKLGDFIEYGALDITSGKSTKGTFGQKIETDYFKLDSGNKPLPDFEDIGLELKTAPIIINSKGHKSKERMVLGIMDYGKALIDGFETFTRKSSHLLIIFYSWKKWNLRGII